MGVPVRIRANVHVVVGVIVGLLGILCPQVSPLFAEGIGKARETLASLPE